MMGFGRLKEDEDTTVNKEMGIEGGTLLIFCRAPTATSFVLVTRRKCSGIGTVHMRDSPPSSEVDFSLELTDVLVIYVVVWAVTRFGKHNVNGNIMFNTFQHLLIHCLMPRSIAACHVRRNNAG